MPPRSILHLRLTESDLKGTGKPGSDSLADFCNRITPAWELSVRGAYLDLTGTDRLYGRGLDGAAHVSRMARDLKGALSAGAASTRLVAELASLTAARAGGGVLAVLPDQVPVFLQSFPVDFLSERRSVVNRLRQLGVRTLGDLQVIPPSLLQSVFGKGGSRLADEAWGRAAGFQVPVHEFTAGDAAGLDLVVGVRMARPVSSGPLVLALRRGLAVRALTLCPGGPARRGRWHLTVMWAEGARDSTRVRGPEPPGWTSWLGHVERLWKRLPKRRQGLLGMELWAEPLGSPCPRQGSLFSFDEADCRLAEVLRLSRRESHLFLGPGSEDLLTPLGVSWYGPGAGMSKPGQGFG
jgi:hypothetical protein